MITSDCCSFHYRDILFISEYYVQLKYKLSLENKFLRRHENTVFIK